MSRVASSRVATLVARPLAEWGYRRYRRTDETPTLGYVAFRKLYGASPRSFTSLSARARAEGAPAEPAGADGLLGAELEEALASLRDSGFYVLRARLAPHDCDDLEAVARRARCRLVSAHPGAPERATFDADDPLAIRYDVDEADILTSATAQRLVADPSIMTLAQRYLDTTPVQDLVAMWWSTPAPHASSAAAQLFHFDLDRCSFVKLFVYLTDVDETTGPHVFVPGSHRAAPRELREDRRYRDDEVRAAFPGDVTITGPRGTVFLADTRGLHKGLELLRGHRLVFQLQLSSSLFGAPYESQLIARPEPELVVAARRYPWTFRRFTIGSEA